MAENPIKVPTVEKVAVPSATPTQDAAALQNQFNQRLNTANQQTNNVYDANLNSQKLQLQNAYQQNLSDQEAAKGKIGGAYQTAANDLAIQYERNRRNLNEQALANGINTGVGSQQQLALNQQYNTNFGRLRGQEAGEMAEAERQIANLKNSYQNQISQAIADNDYQRAKALMDNYNNQQSWMDAQMNRYEDIAIRANERAQDQAIRQNERAEDWARSQQTRYEDQTIRAGERAEDFAQRNRERAEDRQWQNEDNTYNRNLEQAKIAASYGDFSAFANLYGQPTADMMRQTWILQNPDMAWATGSIDRDTYYKLTGQEPHQVPEAGGGGGSSGGGNPGYDWWQTVQGRMASGQSYSVALSGASGGYR